MAFTILEVSKQTGISPHTLRFWAKKELFPYLDRDENGVKYFSKRDVGWVEWVACLRQTGMSLKDVKTYVYLFKQGIISASERKDLLEKQVKHIEKEIKNLKKAKEKLTHKLEIYERMIKTGIDELNPQSQQYADTDELKNKKKKSKK